MTKDFSFQIDNRFLVRNYRRRSKFEPYFLPEKFCVTDILTNGSTLLIENTVTGLCLQRHLNEIKLLNGSLPPLLEQVFRNDNTVKPVYSRHVLKRTTFFPTFFLINFHKNTSVNRTLYSGHLVKAGNSFIPKIQDYLYLEEISIYSRFL